MYKNPPIIEADHHEYRQENRMEPAEFMSRVFSLMIQLDGCEEGQSVESFEIIVAAMTELEEKLMVAGYIKRRVY